MMTVTEYLEGKSLFTEIESIDDSFPFLELNGSSYVTTLDAIILMNHGKREVRTVVEAIPVATLASMIVGQYKDKWVDYESTRLSMIDMKEVRTRTEVIEGEGTRTSTNSNTNKVSAFDSNVLVDDGGSAGSGSDATTEDKTVTITETISKPKEDLKMLRDYGKAPIIGLVMEDIASFICQSVF